MKTKRAPEFYRLFFIWLMIVVLWSIYRVNFITAEWLEEIFIKPIIFILPAILYLLLSGRKINQERLGLHIGSWEKVILWGVIVGLILSLEIILVSFVKGEVIDPGFFSVGFVGANLLVSGATAFWEELLYRGFFLTRLQEILDNATRSNIITAAGFALGHLPIALGLFHYQNLELAAYLALVFILGIINGFLFQKTGNIFASVIVHTMWNFTVGLFV